MVSAWLDNQYAVLSGTSMASPLEAGAELVVMAQMVDSGYNLGNTNIRPAMLNIMSTQATHVGTLDKGLLYLTFDASSSNNFGVPAPPPPPSPPPPPGVTPVSPPDPYAGAPPPPPPMVLVPPPRARATGGSSGRLDVTGLLVVALMGLFM